MKSDEPRKPNKPGKPLSAQERLLNLMASAKVFDLGRPLLNGMSQSPNHPAFRHCLDRRHGDRIRADGGSAAADLITLGCHVGTHVDALAHVSQDGRLYSGIDAHEAQSGGRFEALGIHKLPPYLGRGVLLDIPPSQSGLLPRRLRNLRRRPAGGRLQSGNSPERGLRRSDTHWLGGALR